MDSGESFEMLGTAVDQVEEQIYCGNDVDLALAWREVVISSEYVRAEAELRSRQLDRLLRLARKSDGIYWPYQSATRAFAAFVSRLIEFDLKHSESIQRWSQRADGQTALGRARSHDGETVGSRFHGECESVISWLQDHEWRREVRETARLHLREASQLTRNNGNIARETRQERRSPSSLASDGGVMQ